MRWLPLLLVLVSAFLPIERVVETLEGELIIRSSGSLLLGVSLYFLLGAKRLALVLCCEFWSIAYNLAIALGYYFTDSDLSAWYTPVMASLLCIEIVAVLPRRTRRDSRDNRSNSDNLRGNPFSSSAFASSLQNSGATCRI